MNWLAHVLLSEQKIDFQIGNILSDPLKGKGWEHASEDMIKGMQVHKTIDAFTDSHPLVSKSKKRLREKGLLKPVIIDLTYDYILTKHWDRYCHISIDEYTDTFYKEAKQRLHTFPQRPKEIIDSLIKKDLLNKYQTLDQLEYSFHRMDLRLSQRLRARETASGYFETVCKNMPYLEEDFLEFFPELTKHTKKDLNLEKTNHLIH